MRARYDQGASPPGLDQIKEREDLDSREIPARKTWQIITEPTDQWHALFNVMPEASKLSPFTKKDIFSEGEMLHDMAKAVKTFIMPKRDTPVSAKDWGEMLICCFEEENS